ncbi:CRISPR system Cascade subunit CasB [Allostreptomyces psammosilenae]|uniref:CRISPR system Cascade subunit CasB n=1 Tax=Allostreptomyces psammosilenae TaxID=1892865 RepID=A0A852ZXT8_9ACTN|nr:CRISPR system Cascade subunit CasB [Allostreptomyces psammosilenae]
MSDTTARRYWNRHVRKDGTWRIDPSTGQEMRPPGEDLAAMRSGLGRPAVAVPALWPFYTCEVDDRAAQRGEVSQEQDAEHAALALYGLHQQAHKRPMHAPGTSVGRALRTLRHHERFSQDAVDRRVQAAVNSTSVSTLLYRLRGLVSQLHTIKQPLDYDLLMADILDWHRPDTRQRARRRWGLNYYAWQRPATAQPGT